MKSIIIGGGKLGYYLLKTLKERNHQVTLIERNRDTCDEIAGDIDADIIFGDGTDLDVLKDAGIEEAEVVAAVTGMDEENLVICQIAKLSFSIGKTIARINNPKNINMFKALGVDKTVCSTEVIANLIEWEFEKEALKIVQTFELGAMCLIEIIIEADHPWGDKAVKALDLHDECVIVSIVRDGKIIYPRGSTQIMYGDRVLAVTSIHAMTDLKRQINKSREK
ncbi:MAG: TrkA family potassium uptake protein [Ruminiclostridium sp.]|nr:TrkA family potassium uptake protein [Ruminiclostridium sp.]